jgi:signal transduction histidine kinase
VNPSALETVTLVVTSLLGGGGVTALGVAWLNRKPKALSMAETHKLEAEADEAQAGARLRASEEWERLFARFRAEIDRQDAELVKQADQLVRQAAQIAAQRQEGHRLRNFATELQGFGQAQMKHVDALEDVIAKMGGTPPPRPKLAMPRLDDPA